MVSLALALITLAMLSAIGALWVIVAIIKEITNKDEESTK